MAKKIRVEEMTAKDHEEFEARSDALSSNSLLLKARACATVAHAGVTRKNSKVPYVVHPERVVKLLQEAGVTDEEVLAAAYLHDVLEDTKDPIDDFPERVQRIVRELTMPPDTKDKNAYLAAFAHKSIEANLIKLADRYDNLSDGIKTMTPEWVENYLKGADALLEAASKAGVNRKAAGAKLYAKLSGLRDQGRAGLGSQP